MKPLCYRRFSSGTYMCKQQVPWSNRGYFGTTNANQYLGWARKMRAFFAIFAAFVIFTGGAIAQDSGARLGAPEVLSSLGSPLVVRIPISNATEVTSANNFSVGAPIERNGVPFIEYARLGIDRSGGKTYLLLQSRQANHEPAVGFVIREQLEGGLRNREFVVLVDPPGLALNQGALPEVVPPIIGADSLTTIAQPPAREVEEASTEPQPITRRVASTAVSAGEVTDAAPQARRPRRATRPRAVVETAQLDDGAAPRAQNRSVVKRPKRQAIAPTVSKGGEGEGVLKLSLSTNEITDRTQISEEERASLRDRQLLLDVDDKTSELLDQRFKIIRLERQLADIQLRIAEAEKQLAASGINVTPGATTSSAESNVAVTPAPVPAPAKNGVKIPRVEVSTGPAWWEKALAWTKSNLGTLAGSIVGLLLLLGAGVFGWRRYRTAAASRSVLYVPHEETRPTAVTKQPEVTVRPREPGQAAVGGSGGSGGSIVAGSMKPSSGLSQSAEDVKPLGAPPSAPTPGTTQAIPSSFWDDGGLGGDSKSDESASVDSLFFDETDTDRAPDLLLNTAAMPTAKPGERSRELYLRHRYPEIAMLNPSLDDEKALIHRAVTLYDEGAADFAKRLLKYAAYQRPVNDRFWLALLELLFREKLAHEYAVNAKWFHQHLPRAKEWSEVQRMGFMLNPHEAIFSAAAAAGNEPPPLGRWFPTGELPEISLDLPSLRLELAS